MSNVSIPLRGIYKRKANFGPLVTDPVMFPSPCGEYISGKNNDFETGMLLRKGFHPLAGNI